MSREALIRHLAGDLAAAPPAGAGPLLGALAERYGKALEAVVLYGSCRRTERLSDGLVDLMAVVTGYRAAHGAGPAAAANFLLPPNVYFLEADGEEGVRLRSKYITVTRAQFARRCRGGLDGYFWARFAQPCRLLWARDAEIERDLAEARASAVLAFARRAACLGNGELSAGAFWTRAVGATYRCELRPEPAGAAERLVGHDPSYWARTSALLDGLLDGLQADAAGRLRVELPAARRFIGRAGWWLRRPWSKFLNLARLFKAAGTFANGVDYLAWKVERHTGVRIEPTEAMRRHPRIAAWGLAWKLWRRGVLR